MGAVYIFERMEANTIKSPRICLRRWREEDAAILFRLAAEPELGKRAGWPAHQSVEESCRVIRNYFMNHETWAIELSSTNELIGCVGYLLYDRSHLNIGVSEAEVGYWIGKTYWNNGYATEALHLLVEHCFAEKHFSVLWGNHFTDNPASGRVMEKCGFVEVEHETRCKDYERPIRVLRLEQTS